MDGPESVSAAAAGQISAGVVRRITASRNTVTCVGTSLCGAKYLLLEVDRQGELEQTVGDLAARWDDRVTMRLVGPMAPYDFVVAPKPED